MDEVNAYIASVLLAKQVKKAIEFGSCTGKTLAFVKNFCDVIGIDISSTFVSGCRKRGLKATVGDICTYKDKEKYDLVYTHGCLIHVNHKLIRNAIKNAMSFAPYGIFIESSANEEKGDTAYDAKKYWEHRAKFPGKENDLPMQYYFSHDYEKIFNEMHFKCQVIREFDGYTKTRMYGVCRE